MSSIVSFEIIFDRPQADGTRWVRGKYVAEDHNNVQRDVFIGPRQVSESVDVNAWLSAHQSAVLGGLAEEEEQGGLDMNSVSNPLTYAQNPKWSTEKRIAKTMIYWMMEQRNPRIVIYLKSLIAFLQQNYTAQQIANFLDITIVKVQRMNRRVSAILTDTGTLEELLIAFDAEEGEL